MNRIFLIYLLVICSFSLFSQNTETEKARKYLNSRKEALIKIFPLDVHSISKISELTSIDKIENDTVFTYLNCKHFDDFLSLQLHFEVCVPQSMTKPVKMSSKGKLEFTYPTYEHYVSLMNQFTADFPEITKLEKIGESINGRDILMLKISDHPNVDEAEPEFLYTSSMHGDELTGYMLLMQLIDSLTTNYNSDSRITKLVDSLEIWINPLSNPDGTYAAGNNTVFGATRFNANGVDLNRNFPDPEDGLHPDGNDWQHENIVMMNFMSERHFDFCSNFHTGSEVLNYPWDTWPYLHADDAWYKAVAREYADSVHYYSPAILNNYLTSLNNGITNGYAWYSISGGRGDYTNYYLHGREILFELSYDKLPDESSLDYYLQANYYSLISYIENCLYGIHGFVSDSITGNPVYAKITVVGHDFDNSEIYSHESFGEYFRFIAAGNYSLMFSSPGYFTKIIENVEVFDKQATYINCKLLNMNEISTNNDNSEIQIFPNPTSGKFSVAGIHNAKVIDFVNLQNVSLLKNITICEQSNTTLAIYIQNIQNGMYFLSLENNGIMQMLKVIVRK